MFEIVTEYDDILLNYINITLNEIKNIYYNNIKEINDFILNFIYNKI